MNAEPSPEELRDTAAEREAHYFQGTQLHPFSYDHEAAFWRYKSGVGRNDSGLEQNVALLNLCMMTADECDALREKAEFQGFRKRCREWAKEHKLTSMNAMGKQVMAAVDAIWDELKASEFEVVPPKDSEPLDPKA